MPLGTDFLSQLSLFDALEPEHLARLVLDAREFSLIPEQLVFLEGETAEGLYVVESGWLKGSKIISSGREQVLRYFGTGEAINEVSLFLEVPNPATLIALEPSVVWLIPRDVILAMMEQHPKFMRIMTQNLAKRLLYVVSLVEDLSLLPLEARVAKFLLEHAENNRFERKRWATQAELAARLGTVPDVLHRVLRSLSEAGLIEVTRQHISILDHVGLKEKTQLS